MLNTSPGPQYGDVVSRMKTLDKQLEGELIKHLIVQKVLEPSQGQWFYSVIYYGDWDNDGNRRDWDEMKGLYHHHYMKGVHRRHRNILREHFSRNICLFFTMERHKSKSTGCGGNGMRGMRMTCRGGKSLHALSQPCAHTTHLVAAWPHEPPSEDR